MEACFPKNTYCARKIQAALKNKWKLASQKNTYCARKTQAALKNKWKLASPKSTYCARKIQAALKNKWKLASPKKNQRPNRWFKLSFFHLIYYFIAVSLILLTPISAFTDFALICAVALLFTAPLSKNSTPSEILLLEVPNFFIIILNFLYLTNE